MNKKLVISVSGKGGSGKTTVAALILKVLLKNIHKSIKSILAVDADPAVNLPGVLGVTISSTVGMTATKLKKEIEQGTLAASISKSDLLEAWVYDVLVETPQFDLLAMGRSEGEGCYCYVNSVLTKILDTLSKNYSITLMDMEAGLEHLSRRTDRDVDIMLVVTDPSKMGLETARRIKEITEEVHIDLKEIYLIGNGFSPDTESFLREKAAEIGLKFAGIIPHDPNIMNYNMLGKSLLSLPDSSPAVKAVEEIVKKINLLPEQAFLNLLKPD